MPASTLEYHDAYINYYQFGNEEMGEESYLSFVVKNGTIEPHYLSSEGLVSMYRSYVKSFPTMGALHASLVYILEREASRFEKFTKFREVFIANKNCIFKNRVVET